MNEYISAKNNNNEYIMTTATYLFLKLVLLFNIIMYTKNHEIKLMSLAMKLQKDEMEQILK